MSTRKKGVPKPQVPKNIDFSDLQRSHLTEVSNRQRQEMDTAIGMVLADLGFEPKKQKHQFQIRQDLSGIDFVVVPEAIPSQPGDPKEKDDVKEPNNETDKAT